MEPVNFSLFNECHGSIDSQPNDAAYAKQYDH
jgi:hypothetical protein